MMNYDLDSDGHPNKEGVYLVRYNPVLGENSEIDVYRHPIKGLSCFSEDFGSSGTHAVSDETDCHVSVQFTGLEFIKKVREIE